MDVILYHVNWEAPTVALGVALLGLGGAWVQRERLPSKDRRRIKSDAEILALLPKESASSRLLGEHLDAKVRRLVSRESRGSSRLEALVAGLGRFLLAAIPAAALIWLAVHYGGWWWIAGVYGISLIAMVLFQLAVARSQGEDKEKPEAEEAEDWIGATALRGPLFGWMLRNSSRRSSAPAMADRQAGRAPSASTQPEAEQAEASGQTVE
jgi:hypothetical protein